MIVKFDANGFRGYLRELISSQSQRAFAQAHGISPEHLSRMLRADRPPIPSDKTLKKLAAGDPDIYKRLLQYVNVPTPITVAVPPAEGPITAHDYQVQAARTINPRLSNGQLKAHALWGLAAEVGELQGLYQKKYQGHDFDHEHAKKELGDICWMVAEYATAQGWDLGEVMQANIDKLRARYPDGFDPEHSLHREEGDV